jgi:hypothetical protein
MAKRFPFLQLALIGAGLSLAACSGDDSGGGASSGGSGGTGGGAGSSATGGAAGSTTVEFHATLKGVTAGPDHSWIETGPIEGMKVCQDGVSANCTTSAADGTLTLGSLVPSSEVAMVYSHPDYPTYLLDYVLTELGYSTQPGLVPTTGMDEHLAGSGCTSTPTDGTGVLFFGAPAGSKITITPAPPNGIVYGGVNGFDPSLTEIPAGTPIHLAEAVVCGLQPGTYDIEITQTTGVCYMGEGWKSPGHSGKVSIQAGMFSVFNYFCG